MTFVTLIGKLQEYEMELRKIENRENQEKKSYGTYLEVDSKEVEKEDTPKEDEKSMLPVNRLGKQFGNNHNSNFVKKKKFL